MKRDLWEANYGKRGEKIDKEERLTVKPEGEKTGRVEAPHQSNAIKAKTKK